MTTEHTTRFSRDTERKRCHILDFLTSQPTPEQIAAFRPTLQMQERLSTLLAKNQSDNSTPTEIEELNEYERIEHLVIMPKLGNSPSL